MNEIYSPINQFDSLHFTSIDDPFLIEDELSFTVKTPSSVSPSTIFPQHFDLVAIKDCFDTIFLHFLNLKDSLRCSSTNTVLRDRFRQIYKNTHLFLLEKLDQTMDLDLNVQPIMESQNFNELLKTIDRVHSNITEKMVLWDIVNLVPFKTSFRYSSEHSKQFLIDKKIYRFFNHWSYLSIFQPHSIKLTSSDNLAVMKIIKAIPNGSYAKEADQLIIFLHTHKLCHLEDIFHYLCEKKSWVFALYILNHFPLLEYSYLPLLFEDVIKHKLPVQKK